MVEPTGTGEPTNAAAPNDGGVNTAVLDNLAPKPSDSEPGSTISPPPATDDTGQPQDDVQQPDDGKAERLEQRLAETNKMLTRLGFDPESDIAERFNAGLISKEEILMQAGVTPTAPPPKEQPSSASDKLAQLKSRVGQSVKDGKGILEGDILELLDVTTDLVAESNELQNQNSLERQFAECRDATLNVIGKDPKHTEAPDNIKDIESQMFLSSTDNLVAITGRGDPKSITGKNYSFYAGKNLDKLNELRNYWMEQGRKTAPQPPVPPANPVNPISPSEGGGPITPPETPTTIDNIEERAQAYIESFGQV
jgi:hypothetical protein